MSEHTNGGLHHANSRVDANATVPNELAALDLSDLARAIDMVRSSEVGAEPLFILLRNELSRVEEQVNTLLSRLNQSALELRQLRESVPEALLRNEEERRTLQDQTDRFVARLVEEHAAVLETVRTERDAAIQRVRELSRELTRSGVSSCAPLSEPPHTRSTSTTRNQGSPSPPEVGVPTAEFVALGGLGSADQASQDDADQMAQEVTRATPKFDATDLAGTSGDGR